MTTSFRCSRCGYEHESLPVFKKHLERKTECKAKASDISFMDVKQQFKSLIDQQQTRSESPTSQEKKKKKKKLRDFGDEFREYIRRDILEEYINDPLKGIQFIIKEIYFNEAHEENHTLRPMASEMTVEVHLNERWVRVDKTKTYDKLIYRAVDILENNTLKKHWTPEFKNFIKSMGEIDCDELLFLIREEVEETILNAEKEWVKAHDGS